ncbi:MAG: hypothetical protein JXR25_12205 [Pontiellaceae bacterium]|nr:hypothetical protein [Pontiellaceae bacterium]MBN2785577.1 hypothetical protein [Pontiellaceae bacterium]
MPNEIQINEMLMEREDRFVEIYDIERQINIILGGEAYPFPAPPDELPSRQKRTKARKEATQRAPQPIRIRKLDPETEKAYRVVYIDHETERQEIHFNPKSIALLANTSLPHIQVLSIETLRLNSDNSWDSVERLFDAEAEAR